VASDAPASGDAGKGALVKGPVGGAVGVGPVCGLVGAVVWAPQNRAMARTAINRRLAEPRAVVREAPFDEMALRTHASSGPDRPDQVTRRLRDSNASTIVLAFVAEMQADV
jgi:hypothetical protein